MMRQTPVWCFQLKDRTCCGTCHAAWEDDSDHPGEYRVSKHTTYYYCCAASNIYTIRKEAAEVLRKRRKEFACTPEKESVVGTCTSK